MKQRRSGWTRIITLLLVLALLGGGAYYLYQRDFGGSKETAYVQSVSAIIGSGSVGLYAQYNGIVEAKDVIEVNPNGSMPIKECYVSAGSKIREGEPLFCYDVDDLELQYAQIEIDISGVENNLRTYREQLSALNTKLKKAKEDERYAIELDIQTVELDIRKAEFDLEDKHRRADEMQAVIDASEVLSPVTGTVRSVRDSSGSSDPFGYGYGDSSGAYITIIAGTAFCVKGSVNEQTIYTLYVGMPVLIRSRVNDRVLRGTIYRIDTESPESSQSAMYYYYDGGERTSQYSFYVEPDSIEGLMIGQHVVIDLNTDTDTSTALMLPAAFLFEENGSFYAWAADPDGRIEKRAVTVGAYDEETECWEILEGLTRRDRIAFPDETIHAGMLATETAFTDSGDNGGMTAIPDGGDPGVWNTADDGNTGAWKTEDDGNSGAWKTEDDDSGTSDTLDDGADTVTFGG